MRSPANWLLVETLSPNSPGVIAVGATPRKRTPLVSFVRESDRNDAQAAVSQCHKRGVSATVGFPSRKVVADPIADDTSRRVHAAWVRIAPDEDRRAARPSAWAFTWNLETGVARRSPIVSDTESWSSLGIDQTRSLASGLSHLELGPSIAPVLAGLVEAGEGSTLQHTAVENRPDGSARRIQFYARFSTESTSSDTPRPMKIVRGVSVDLGKHDHRTVPTTPPSLGDLIARAAAQPNEHRAIMDPATLEILYWYGPPPTDLHWDRASDPGAQPLLHPEDLHRSRGTIERLASKRTEQIDLTLRFLNSQLNYVPRPLSLQMIDLSPSTRALLAVLKPQPRGAVT